METNHNPFNVKLSHEDLRVLLREDVISEAQYLKALHYSGIIPDKSHWRSFLQLLLSSIGTVFLLSGIIFFFAFNWAEMSQWQKFGGIEIFIVVAVILAWIKGPDKLSGKLATLAAGTLIGVLMAVYGQIYQTGADEYELFMYWAILLLPLVLVTRFPAFWVMWLVIANIAIIFYVEQGLGGGFYSKYVPHFLLALNLSFLCAWNLLQLKGIKWVQEPWTNWIVAIACLITMTVLAGESIDGIARGWARNLVYNNINIAMYVAFITGFFLFFQFK